MTPFWGKGYSDGDIRAFLDGESVRHEQLDDDRLFDRTVEALTEGKVIGWFQERFEWGPRALGHRSILADPRRADMKEIVNTKIKFREPYRPFAPSVLNDRVHEYFDAPGVERQYPARFMLLVADVRPSKYDVIPAVTHVDGTGRLQTVLREGNSRYYDLIERFGQVTGVPVVLNTSFNLRGEPIVGSPREAYSTFMRSEMDTLVLGNYVVEKTGDLMPKSIRAAGRRVGIMRELLGFLWAQKLWWLMPMVLVLLVLGILLVFAQSSAIAPFIYTLF